MPDNLPYSLYVKNHLFTFHKQYGPHLADIERELCHIIRYKTTIRNIQDHQQSMYFDILSNKMDIIIRNRWDINNGVDNDDIRTLFDEYGRNYSRDNFDILLRTFIKKIPRKIINEWDPKNRHNALQDESTWICKICKNTVEDETDDNGADIPHPSCEICFGWFHVQCTGIAAYILQQTKNVFLCKEHSGTGQFITKPKKGFRY